MTTQSASSQSAFSAGIYEASGRPAGGVSVHLTWGGGYTDIVVVDSGEK